MQIEIPNKSLFKLNEVCDLTGVKPYVLRFWESEFEQISPISSASGQKMYEHKDIDAIVKIKDLLYEQKLTIEKARQELLGNVVIEQESEEVSNQSEAVRKLSDRDLQKIILAKAKLGSIVTQIQSIKKKYKLA